MAERHAHYDLIERLSALSDLARLRILRLLDQEELTVGELARALQLPQSTVSRHLKLLHDGGWIAKRSAGTASIYRLGNSGSGGLLPDMQNLWTVAKQQLGSNSELEQDSARLQEVIAERRIDSKSFFGQLGGEWDSLRHELFGETFTTESLLHLLSGDWVVADIGCGTGDASEHLAPLVHKVIAIDREPAMLEAARKRLGGRKNVEFRIAEIGSLPLKNKEVNAAVLFLVLVHVEDVVQGLREIRRTLAPGGKLLIVDLAAHQRDTYLHTMGHRHLGFDEKQLKSLAKSAGFESIRYRMLRPNTQAKGPNLFAAVLQNA